MYFHFDMSHIDSADSQEGIAIYENRESYFPLFEC